ncbi:MAG: phosphoglucosamine mutase, partial [Ruminococcus sp.]|nr:phosphoglucosamine mutase [Ruminococcus sp.]
TLSELAAPFVVYPQVLEKVKVKDKSAAQNDPDVKAAVEEAAEALGTSGRILVRESGTEPLVRVMVEAENEDICRTYVNKVVDVMKRNGHTI